MNSIFLSELQSIDEIGELESVLSEVPLDDVITGASSPEASTWNRPTSELHHWQALNTLDETLSGRPKKDVPAIEEMLTGAMSLYSELSSEGVPFDRFTDGEHLKEWLRAIREFRRLVSI